MQRGGGGLVTALSGLVSHRDALWIASAMTDEDVAVSEERGGPVEISIDGIDYRVLLVGSDAEAYDRFYNVIANPILWFIQHYLWDLSNAPDIRQEELDAWDYGYQAVNRDIAGRVLGQIDGQERPLVMLHDYHLYTAPGMIRARSAPTPSSTTSSTSPGRSPTAGGSCRRRIREAIFRGHARQRHHRLPHPRLLPQLPALLRRTARARRRLRARRWCATTAARRWPAPTRSRSTPSGSAGGRVAGGGGCTSARCCERRRKHLIIRVDRADLSKNVLRGFTAFDTFLDQHPEFREKVTFIAHLQPSRQDVPEYAEYLERIEALVAVVNHRHGTTDWMPIDLQDLRELPRGGRPLQALRPADGQLALRRDEPGRQGGAGGQHPRRRADALREHRLARGARRLRPLGQPVRHPGAGRRDLPRADHGPRGAARCAPGGCKEIITARDPGDWVDEQLADIRTKRAPAKVG